MEGKDTVHLTSRPYNNQEIQSKSLDFYIEDLKQRGGNAIKSMPPAGLHLAVAGDEATWDGEAARA